MMTTRWMAALLAGGLALGGGLLAQEDSAPAPSAPERTLATCETELLDVRSALIDAQEQLALWQARAIQAEAKLARQEIERQRQARAREPQ